MLYFVTITVGLLLASVSGSSCPNVNVISRSQWGARAPNNVTTMYVPVAEFIMHHTQGRPCSNVSICSSAVTSIQDYHMNIKGLSDIEYNFLIGEDGNVYEGRGWTHVGAHTQGYNSKAFGAAILGTYTYSLPNSKALQAAKDLIACGVHLGKISANYRLYGHRDAVSTSCPGDALYKKIQTWPHYSHNHP